MAEVGKQVNVRLSDKAKDVHGNGAVMSTCACCHIKVSIPKCQVQQLWQDWTSQTDVQTT